MSGNIVRFPRMLLTASRTRGVTLAANQKAFTCAPSVTKHEIKEYLTKIYGLDVRKVQTSNYDGKIKRSGPGYSKYFKEKAYKKAIVTFGDDVTDDIPSVST